MGFLFIVLLPGLALEVGADRDLVALDRYLDVVLVDAGHLGLDLKGLVVFRHVGLRAQENNNVDLDQHAQRRPLSTLLCWRHRMSRGVGL
jgi:hypothetical protein